MNTQVTMQTVLDKINETHNHLTKYVDKQIEEARSKGFSTAETNDTVDKINNDLTELRQQYDELVLQSKRPSGEQISGGQSDDPEVELRKSAFTKFMRYGLGESGRSMMDDKEVRALSDSADQDGGFLVPTEFENDLLHDAYNDSALRSVMNASPTSRNTVQLPSLSKPKVAWGTKNLAITPEELQAGGERIEIFDLRALVLIHNNTLDDADADVWGELLDMFAMAIGEAEDDAFAVGAGNNSPQGVLAHPDVIANYTPTGVAGALFDGSNNGVDALITMLQSLKQTYRRNATWAMNSQTEGDVRKLKDQNGQYLWQPPVQAGSPATLLGRPLVNPEGMPGVAANASPIVLGDFRKGYRAKDRKGLTVQRLVERYAEYDQTGFTVKKRVGGQVVLPEAFTTLKVAAS